MPQLQLNSGPQDSLLYDNSRSYFSNVGYHRTSNFQTEYRDIDSQNAAAFGTTVQFVIPKAADLLSVVDLMVTIDEPSAVSSNTTAGVSAYNGWVESLGYAMIDKVTFSVGSHDCENISGDQLNIINELMRPDSQRLGLRTILKTGRPLVYAQTAANEWAFKGYTSQAANRVINSNAAADGHKFGRKLIIPLGLFFSKHPSSALPLASIAGCNDVRIAIKLRPLNELTVGKAFSDGNVAASSGNLTTNVALPDSVIPTSMNISNFKLRCHFVHVTGPEATSLISREHVRLLKQWQNQNQIFKVNSSLAGAANKSLSMDLSFLHPVQEFVITIRKVSELSSSTDTTAALDQRNRGAQTKNRFAYHGGGYDPNVDSWLDNTVIKFLGSADDVTKEFCKLNNIQLTLNGQERHPSLSNGIDTEYLQDRLMPLLHSNAGSTWRDTAPDGPVNDENTDLELKALGQMLDRKDIFVYPFSLNPEGHHPSGAVNMSKVSHARMTFDITGYTEASAATDIEYQVDVYGISFNWLQLKDGRALTSFA